MDPTVAASLISGATTIGVVIVGQWLSNRRADAVAAKADASREKLTTQVSEVKDIAKGTHDMVNSRLTEFKAELLEATAKEIVAASARGELIGAAKERARSNEAAVAAKEAVATAPPVLPLKVELKLDPVVLVPGKDAPPLPPRKSEETP